MLQLTSIHSSRMHTAHFSGRNGEGGGISVQEEFLSRGETPSPVDRMTDASENITFPKLRLGAVKIPFYHSPLTKKCLDSFDKRFINSNNLRLRKAQGLPSPTHHRNYTYAQEMKQSRRFIN